MVLPCLVHRPHQFYGRLSITDDRERCIVLFLYRHIVFSIWLITSVNPNLYSGKCFNCICQHKFLLMYLSSVLCYLHLTCLPFIRHYSYILIYLLIIWKFPAIYAVSYSVDFASSEESLHASTRISSFISNIRDWPELVVTVVLGLILSFAVAKLVTVAVSFQDDNSKHAGTLELTDEINSSDIMTSEVHKEIQSSRHLKLAEVDESPGAEIAIGHDDGWEGVESNPLDETFSAAAAFVAKTAFDQSSQKISNSSKLQLYGLYKIATEGPCCVPPPTALKIYARERWSAWQRLGDMTSEEAMQMYVDLVTQLYPTWTSGSTNRMNGVDGDSLKASGETMGPVFSSLIHEEQAVSELKMHPIHVCARDGDVDSILSYINSGISVDVMDSEGRTSLHWAVDRGHLDVVELLLSIGADANAQDNEGQTPLHYAALCGREAIAESLLKQHANLKIKDNDGFLPCDLCDAKWKCMGGIDDISERV